MSTLSSPRPSITSARTPTPTGSRRPSVDSLAVSTTSTPTQRAPSPSLAQRRNRTALRDYYNLKASRGESASTQSRAGSILHTHDEAAIEPSTPITHAELDNADFDPTAYVSHLLATSSLSTILRADHSLVSDIRTLDGERKALVYDNYSKLISAVETIGKMRTSLEEEGAPMVMTKTLGPAVGFVAETASSMIKQQEEAARINTDRAKNDEVDITLGRQTVRWVLDTPRRLRLLLLEEKLQEAKQDWKEIKGILDKWEGVRGVGNLRQACKDIMGD